MGHQISNDDILLYLCDELEHERCVVVREALAAEPHLLRQACEYFDMLVFLGDSFSGPLSSSRRVGSCGQQFANDDKNVHVSPEWNKQERPDLTGSPDGNTDLSNQILRWAQGEVTEDEKQLIEGQIKNNPGAATAAKRIQEVLNYLKISPRLKSSDYNDKLRAKLVSELPSSFERSDKHEPGIGNHENPSLDELHEDMERFWNSSKRAPVYFNQKLRSQVESELLADSVIPAKTGPVVLYRIIQHQRKYIGIAASIILMIILVGTLFFAEAEKVYALDDIPEQMNHLKSVYIKGRAYWGVMGIYDDDPAMLPIEYYYERPNRLWKTKPLATSNSYFVSDGKQYANYDEKNRTYKTGTEIEFRSKLYVENSFQANIIEQLVGELSDDYRKLKTENINGAAVDVYEQIRPISKNTYFRLVIWFNPKSGYPVKSHWYLKRGTKPERLYVAYDIIQPNAPPRDGMFDFTPPDDFEIVKVDIQPDNVLSAMYSTESQTAAIRFVYSIYDQAFLVCWAYKNNEGATNTDLSVKKDEHELPTHHIRLTEEQSGKFLWHWSLLVPDDQNYKIETFDYEFVFKTNSKPMSIITFPMRFEENRLEQALFEVQQFARPEIVEAGKQLTLKQLQSLIEGVSE